MKLDVAEDIAENSLQDLAQVQMIVASDVVYDRVFSSGLAKFLSRMFSEPLASNQRRSCYIAVEKRINFSVDTMSEGAHEYDYFISQLTGHKLRFRILYDRENLQLLPQFSLYKRNRDLVLLEIS